MMMQPLTELPIHQLKRAVNLRERIDLLKNELDELLAGSTLKSAHRNHNGHSHHHLVPTAQRGLSATGRERIAAAQRLRWSKYKISHPTPEKPASGKPRLSAAGRAKVAAAVRARWDRYRAAKARTLRAK